MIYLYAKDRRVLGKFNLRRTTWIAENKRHNDTRLDRVIRTTARNYILVCLPMLGGEEDQYRQISPEEVIRLMEEWGYEEAAILAEFPRYREEETIRDQKDKTQGGEKPMKVSEFIEKYKGRGRPEIRWHDMPPEDFLLIGTADCRILNFDVEECWLMKTVTCEDGDITVYSERIAPLRRAGQLPR